MRPTRLGVLILLGLTASLSGCASPPAALRFETLSTGRAFGQEFATACFTSSDAGDCDVVLIDNGETGRPAPTGPLTPAPAPPLRQVVHLRILWRPLRGTHTDAPSATNAIIDWTVRSTAADGTTATLRYGGAGFVEVYGSRELATLTIRNATIELVDRAGSMRDPLGRSALSGHFTAHRNDQLVAATLADLQSGGETASQSASASGQ